MHVKPGKGAAFVRVKIERYHQRWCSRDNIPSYRDISSRHHIERKKMQYLYNDGEFYNYMDNETYEQIMISAEEAGESMKFVKENEEVTVSLYQGNAFAIEPPITVELVITESGAGC